MWVVVGLLLLALFGLVLVGVVLLCAAVGAVDD
jgi:hypothetical protein